MAISRVTSQDAKGTSSTSSVSATYPGATTSGNLLIATAWANIGTDTLAISGWTKLIGSAASSTGVALFYKLADGTETTVTCTGGNTNARIHIYEYTGNANPIVTDGSNTNTGASGTSVTGPSITTTNANDLIFAVFATASGAVTSPSVSSPFGTRQADASAIRLFDGDQIVSATGSYSATASWTTAATTRNLIGAFQAASSTPTQELTLMTMGIGA